MTRTIIKLSLLLLVPIALASQQSISSSSAYYFENSIIHSTQNSEQHTTLTTAVVAAELDQVLDSDGPFTVFAPSDAAFEKLSSGKISELLLPQNKSELQTLLTYHMVAGHLSASKILRAMCRGGGVATFTTVQGNLLTATMDGLDIVLSDSFGNKARITTADENQCNGVIHVIDSVILPKKI